MLEPLQTCQVPFHRAMPFAAVKDLADKAPSHLKQAIMEKALQSG